MSFVMPDFSRCCFCVPLRYGILIIGYLNLLFNIFVICVEGMMGYIITSNNLMMYRAVGLFRMWNLLYLIELFFDLVLLVGTHIKKSCLIKIYYYYGIMATVAAVFTYFIVRYNEETKEFYVDYVDISLAITGFVLHVYLLLLIRAELLKLKLLQEQLSYENQMSEVDLEQPKPGNCDKNAKNSCKI